MQEIVVYDIENNILDTLVQWDKGIKIYIKETDIDQAYDVHFTNCNSESAMIIPSEYNEGVLSVSVPNDILTEPHVIVGYICVTNNTDEFKSIYAFRIPVRKRPKPANYIYSDEKEFITFGQVLKEAQDFANAASESATQAELSASEAKESEDKAKDSETNAKASEQASKTSETNAKNSELESKNSEIASKESETNAKASEVNAKASEDATKESEINAKESENNAKASEDATKISETNAKASEDNAKASESIATQKASDANVSSTNAASSAATASQKADEALESANDSEDFAKLSESYAHGGTGTRVGEDTDSSKFYSDLAQQLLEQSQQLYDQAQKIVVAATNGALIPSGTILFEDLPTEPKIGYMYNISNDFTTDERFAEGEGVFYRAGANVYWSKDEQWDVMIGVQVTGVKGNAENIYRVGNINITPENIGLDNTKDIDKYVASAKLLDGSNKSKGNSKLSENEPLTIVQRNENGYINDAVRAGSYESDSNVNDLQTFLQNKNSFVGTVAYEDGTWFDAISVRHRNGEGLNGDGLRYGMLLYSSMTVDNDLWWNKQRYGNWGDDRKILDSANFKDFVPYRSMPLTYDYDNNFRTQTKGDNNAGDFISTVRTENADTPYAGRFGSGLAWGKGDTHGYLYLNYDSTHAYVGGGNQNKLNWVREIGLLNDDRKLESNGAIFTGGIEYKGSKATHNMIDFIDNTADVNGNGIAIGGGGATLIGGGESTTQTLPLLSSGGDERLILSNDAGIDFYTNCQNGIGSAKHITMNTDGTITAAGFNGQATHLRDSASGASLSASYNSPGLSSTEWLAAWNGTSLRAISPDNVISGRAIKLHEYITTQTPSDASNQWYKIATLIVAYQYGSASVAGKIYTDADGGSVSYSIEYRAHLKQQNAMGQIPSYSVRVINKDGISQSNLRLIITTNTSSQTVGELWCKVDGGYRVHRNIILNTAGNVSINTNMALNASPSSGNYVEGTLSGVVNMSACADKLGRNGNATVPMTFNWNGQSGQPNWLWGGNDGSNMYVYNPSNFSVNYAASAGLINGLYTSNGGQQSPGYIPNGKVRFNMMNAFKGLSNPTGAYMDCILMDTYTGDDVPYVTGIGVTKNSGSPRMFIANGAKGGTGNWANQVEVITSGNIGSQSVDYANNSKRVDGKILSQSNDRYDVIPYVDVNGVMNIGKYIDFHESNLDWGQHNVRMHSSNSKLYVNDNEVITRGNIPLPLDMGGTGAAYESRSALARTLLYSLGSSSTAPLFLYGRNSGAVAGVYEFSMKTISQSLPITDAIWNSNIYGVENRVIRYTSVTGLSNWSEVRAFVEVGDAYYAWHTVTMNKPNIAASAFVSNSYFGCCQFLFEFDNNRVGAKIMSRMGWTAEQIRITRIEGIKKV